MKRLALLIGSPSHPKTPNAGNYLEGVKTDIENMHRFLSSSVGGAWSTSEIKVFPPNPKQSDVDPCLKDCENADFAFIYFSGHGYTDSERNPKVLLNQNDHLDVVTYVANRAKHQVTIIDACRNFPEYSNFDGEYFIEGIDFPNPNPITAKKAFNEYILNLPNTRVLICATAEGKSSMDYGSKFGGLFSITLLSVVKSKLKTNNQLILRIAEVFNIAKLNTQKIQPKQVPQIYKSDLNSEHLPFAVNPNSTQHLLLEKNNKLIEDIAKTAIIGGSILLAGYLIGSLISGNKK